MAQQDIIDELNYLNETKGLIKQAIIGKGQTIAADTPFREYATKINNISEVEKNYMTLDPELRNTLKSTYNNSNWYIGDYSISINTTTFKITITNFSTSETYQVDMPEIDFTDKSGGFYVFKANNANEYNIYFAYMGPTGEISEYYQPIRVNKYILNVYTQRCVTSFVDKLIGNFYYSHSSLKLLQLGKTDNLILMISTRSGWSPYPTTFYWYNANNDNVTTFTYGSDITSNYWVSLNEKCFYSANDYSGIIYIEKDGSWQLLTCGLYIYGVNNLNNKIIGQYPKSSGNTTTIYTANIELNSSGSYVVSPKQVLIPNGTWGATDWYHFNGGYAHWLDDYNAILMINIGNNTSPSSIRITTADTLNQTFNNDTLTLSTKQLNQNNKMDTSKFYVTINSTDYVYGVSAEGIEVETGLEYENKEYYLPDNLELGTSADLLSGKAAILNNGLVRGTMPNNGALSYTPTTSQQTIPAGYTSGGTIGAVTSAIDSNIQASNIKAGVTILGVQGNVEPDKPDQTKSCTPTTSQQIIEPDTGYELTSVTVEGVTNAIDQNIVAENIKKDVEILGVTGTLEQVQQNVLDVSDEQVNINGNTLVFSVPSLPYVELEYIESTGTQYINTNIMPTGRFNFYIDFISHDSCDTSNFGTIFGSRQSAYAYGYQLTTFSPTTTAVKGHFLYGTSTYTTESSVNEIRYDAGITKNQRCSIYTRNYVLVNGEGNDINLTSNLFTSSYPIYLFALNEANNVYENGIVTLYNVKFYYDDRLIADFIPVKRRSDDEICLYDKVTEQFFTNQGTGDFIAGPEI